MDKVILNVQARMSRILQTLIKLGFSWQRILCFGGIAICFLFFRNDGAKAQDYITTFGQAGTVAPAPAESGYVETANGSLHLEIPLGSFPQRGSKVPLPVKMVYDNSRIWSIQQVGSSLMWSPYGGLFALPSGTYKTEGGWYLVPNNFSSANYNYWTYNQNTGVYTIQNFSFTDQTGAAHYFPITVTCTGPGGQGGPSCTSSTTGDALATDSSGYHMYISNPLWAKVYAKDGTLVLSYPVGSKCPYSSDLNSPIAMDSNGNSITYDNRGCTKFTDTLGRTVVQTAGDYTGGYVNLPNSQYPNSQTGTSQFVITMATINVKTNFGQSGVGEYSTTVATFNVVQSIAFPDTKTVYSFKYDCDSSANSQVCGSAAGQSSYYGVLTSMTLPTGGVVSYYYSVVTDAYNNKALWLVQRAPIVGGGATYGLQVVSTCGSGQVGCKQNTYVTNGNGDYTITTLTMDNGAWPTQIQSYDHAGNLLSNVITTWDFSQSCPLQSCHGHAYIRKLSETTTMYTPNGGTLTKKTAYAYDSPQNGNITSIKEWEFYPGASPTFPSTPDRATYMTYYYLTGATQNNISRPLSVTVCNNSGSDSDCPGGGSKVSQNKITYDSYGTNGLTLVSGIVNHDDTDFGTSNTGRGNPTQIQNWVTGSTYVTTQLSYDTTGQVLQKIDPNNNVTRFGYSDNFFSETGASTMSAYTPTPSTNAYVTNVTLPPVGSNNFLIQYGYYFGHGERATATDPNNAVDYTYFWDPMDRPTQAVHPIGWSLTNYTSTIQVDTYTTVNDATASVNCSSCRHNQFNFDSIGRKVNENLANAPGGAINVDTTYDQNSRVFSVSHPYVNQSTRVFETYSYDGLNRTTQVMHPDSQSLLTEYGAFAGNVTQQGSPTTYGYGYPVFKADEAGKETLQWVDGFGRVIEVDEPSQSSNTPSSGTVTISGSEQSVQYKYQCGPGPTYCYQTIWDYGQATITVNGFQASTLYNQTTNTTCAALASSLASSLNAPGSPVLATSNGCVITLTSLVPGAQTDYSLSASVTTSIPQYIQTPSFSATTSGSTLTGGTGGISVSPYVTLYTYDAANRLTQVIQGSQTRAHVYDGLGRILSTQTPEVSNTAPAGQQPQQCPVTFTYDNNGNVLTRTAPAPNQTGCTTTVTTSYCYDALNRLTSKAYTAQSCPMSSPAVTYMYDVGGAGAHALGRMTSMSDSSGSETYSYDIAGRITQVQKVIGTTTYTTSYQLYANGQLNQITYPSTRVVQQNIDSIGRPTGVTSGGVNYTGNITYNPAGQVTGFTYGNGVVTSYGYSPDRSQMISLSYTNSSNVTLFSANYGYKNGQANCGTGTIAGNNGSIQCIQDMVDNGRSAVYGYDSLNRLISAVTTGSSGYSKWGYSWTYDRYGNRTAQTITAGSGFLNTLSFGTLPGGTGAYTNRPDGYSFDAAGNMLNDGVNNLTFDAENRTLSTSGSGGSGTYTYDDHGMRVKKVSGGATTVYVFAGKKDIAEYDNGAAAGSPSREYIYSGGRLVATVSGTNTTYHHADHLSVRVSTDASGNKLGEQGHYPYGEQWYATNTTTKFFFTSYSRDTESGLDYALTRFYINRFGRFGCVDPVLGHPADPQSWNRYAYVRNNPINSVDPTGKDFMKWFIQTMMKVLGSFFGFGPFLNFNTNTSIGGTPPTFPDDSISISPQELALAAKYSTPPFLDPGTAYYDPGVGDARQNAIESARSKLHDVLVDDPDCMSFLGGRGASPLTVLKSIPITHDYVGSHHTQAVTNSETQMGSLVPLNPSITINDNGWFFTRGARFGDMNSGTPLFQASTLLHELGHATGELLPDNAPPLPLSTAEANQALNESLLQKNCAKTLASFSNK